MKIQEAKLVVLLLGFLTGNLFGTLLSFLRQFLIWDVLIIIVLLLASEIISYISYNKKDYKKKTNEPFPFSLVARTPTYFLPCLLPLGVSEGARQVTPFYFNIFKIGVMIGFFVDAFKVGS